MSSKMQPRWFVLPPLLIALFLLAVPSVISWAVEKNDSSIFSDISRYREFYGAGMSIYGEYMELITKVQKIDELSGAYLDEKITREYAETQKRIISAQLALQSQSAGKKLIRLPIPAQIKSKKIQRAAQLFFNYLNTLPDSIEEMVGITNKLFNACLLGDLILISKYDILSRKSMVTLLEGENILTKLQSIQLENNNPKAWLYKTVVHLNESVIALIKTRVVEISEIDEGGEVNQENSNSQTYIELARISLNSARKTISIGLEKIEPYKRQYSAGPKNLVDTLALILDSFYESFKVEYDILQIMEKMVEMYPSDEGSSESMVLIESLVAERVDLEAKRMRLLPSALGSRSR